MKKLNKGLAAGLAAGVLSVGLVIPAIAQDGVEDGETSSDEITVQDRRAARDTDFAAALAEELGLDVDTVTEALSTVHETMHAERFAERQAAFQERLADAVEAGELTQEQADALIAAHDSDMLGFGSRGGRDGHPGGHHRGGPNGGGGFGHGFGPPVTDGTDA